MDGWLSKDVEELKTLVEAFCTHGCVNCYWYSAKPMCLGGLVTNIDLSLDTLKKSITRAKNDISTYL